MQKKYLCHTKKCGLLDMAVPLSLKRYYNFNLRVKNNNSDI